MTTQRDIPSIPRHVDRNYISRGLVHRHLDDLNTALWIFDIDRSRVTWANKSALSVWQAESMGELLERDLTSDM